MSDEHKAALAQGRSEGKAVRDYLEALRANKPKRGRKRTADSIKKRLAAIDAELRTPTRSASCGCPGASATSPPSWTRMQQRGRPRSHRGGVRQGRQVLQRAPGHLLRVVA